MAHPDLDRVFDHLVTFSKKMLDSRGEFAPHGAAIDNGGKLAIFGAQDDSDRTAAGLIRLIEGYFRTLAAQKKIRACGLSFDVMVQVPDEGNRKSDAIQCRLEHANGESVNVFTPWKRGLLGRIQYGKVFAGRGTREIFPG